MLLYPFLIAVALVNGLRGYLQPELALCLGFAAILLEVVSIGIISELHVTFRGFRRLALTATISLASVILWKTVVSISSLDSISLVWKGLSSWLTIVMPLWALIITAYLWIGSPPFGGKIKHNHICKDCKFYTPSAFISCAVNPVGILRLEDGTETDCIDYEKRKRGKG